MTDRCQAGAEGNSPRRHPPSVGRRGYSGATQVTTEPSLRPMSGGRLRGTLDDVTGDFLPQRRPVSARAQLLALAVLLAVAAVAFYLYL